MPNAPSHSEKGWRAFFRRCWHLLTRWGAIVGALVVFLFFLLHHLHVLHWMHDFEDQGLKLTLFYAIPAILLFLAEFVREIEAESRQRLEHLQSEMKMFTSKSQALLENLKSPLCHLNGCIDDMKKRAELVGPNEKVVIEHIGLDMSQAWELIEKVLHGHHHLKNVDYRLVMMSNKESAVDPDEVAEWRPKAGSMLDTIWNHLRGAAAHLRADGRKLKVRIKTYDFPPIVHGFAIRKPAAARVCYVAVCRWGGKRFRRFEWGAEQYHRITGDPEDPAVKDLVDIFEGFFRHFWKDKEPDRAFNTETDK